MAARRPKAWVIVSCGIFTLFGIVLLASGSPRDRVIGAVNVAFFGFGGLAAILASTRGKAERVETDVITFEGRVTQALVFPLNRRRTLFAVFGLVAFIVTGILMLVFADQLGQSGRYGPTVIRVVGVVCVATFGAFLAMAVRGLSSGEQYIALTPEGLVQHAVTRLFVPWEAIGDVQLLTFNDAPILGLQLSRPELVKSSLAARISRKMNDSFYGVDVSLPLQGVDVDPEDLAHRVATLVSDPQQRSSIATSGGSAGRPD